MFLADGPNKKMRIILRETLEELTNFGDGGRQPGQFYGVHSIATDSKGNIYTTETYEESACRNSSTKASARSRPGARAYCGRNKSGACRIPRLMPVQKRSGLTELRA